MLFELSENISDHDLKDIKFLLRDTLPHRKLQQDVVRMYQCKQTLMLYSDTVLL